MPQGSVRREGVSAGVYVITNTINGKLYVGSAVRVEHRMRQHDTALRGNRHVNQHLQAAWNLYGPGAFKFNVLLYCYQQSLLLFEQRAMDVMRPEYNIAIVAGSPMRGRCHSDETRAKLSSALKDYYHNPEMRAKVSACRKGSKLSAETRAKISAAKTGKPLSDEHRAKISAGMKGKRNRSGYKHGPEARAKMSEVLKGNKRCLGNVLSAEHRARVGAGVKRAFSERNAKA